MSQQTIYQAAKPSIKGQKIDVDKAYGDQCVDVVLYLAQKYFPGVAWQILIPVVPSAKLLGSHHNDKYFEWIPNDHNNPNQLPIQGDFLVFDATPQAGYSNQTKNPDGHTGPLDSCDTDGYTLLMQDGSNPSGVAFLQHQSWKFRPCLGWLRPRLAATAKPAPAKPVSKPVAKPAAKQTITLPETTGPWHLRDKNNFNKVLGVIDPRVFKRDLTYTILGHPSQYLYTIQSEDYGIGNIDVQGSDVIIK